MTNDFRFSKYLSTFYFQIQALKLIGILLLKLYTLSIKSVYEVIKVNKVYKFKVEFKNDYSINYTTISIKFKKKVENKIEA